MGYVVGYIVMSLMIFSVYKLYYVYQFGFMAEKKDYFMLNASIFVSMWVAFFAMSYFDLHMILFLFLGGIVMSIASVVIRIYWAQQEFKYNNQSEN